MSAPRIRGVETTGYFQSFKQRLYDCWCGRKVAPEAANQNTQKKVAKVVASVDHLGSFQLPCVASPTILSDAEDPGMRAILVSTSDVIAFKVDKPETLQRPEIQAVSTIELHTAFANNLIFRTLFHRECAAVEKRPKESSSMKNVVRLSAASGREEATIQSCFRSAMGAEFRDNLGLSSTNFIQLTSANTAQTFAQVVVTLIKKLLKNQTQLSALSRKIEEISDELVAIGQLKEVMEPLVEPINKKIETTTQNMMGELFGKFQAAAQIFVTACKKHVNEQGKKINQADHEKIFGALQRFEDSFSEVVNKYKAFKPTKEAVAGQEVVFKTMGSEVSFYG